MARYLTLDDAAADRTLTGDAPTAAERPSFFKRMLVALARSRQRSAEREIGRFIAMRGGQLTDDLEREISRRFGGPASRY